MIFFFEKDFNYFEVGKFLKKYFKGKVIVFIEDWMCMLWLIENMILGCNVVGYFIELFYGVGFL